MAVKHIFWGLILAVLASIGWRYTDAETVQQWVHPQEHKPVEIKFDNMEPPSAGPAPTAEELNRPRSQSPAVVRVAGSMRKCKKGNEVIYTDGDCPSGSKEMNLKGGSVTVIPGQQVAPSNTDSGASRANVRDLLTDPKKDAELREKRMDRIINQ